MRFTWEKERINWFVKASEYTGFHRELAKHITPFVTKDDTLCDFGCGLGLLDMELSRYVKHITAVDVSEDALSSLESNMKNKGITNITILRKDAKSLQGKWDIGIMSFFGESKQDMKAYRSLCKKKLIQIVNMVNDSTLYPKKHRRTAKITAEKVEKELKELKMHYNLIQADIEFGQPLHSEEDAVAYIEYNAPNASKVEIDNFLEKNLLSTGREDYPFYLPNEKHLGIFVIF